MADAGTSYTIDIEAEVDGGDSAAAELMSLANALDSAGAAADAAFDVTISAMRVPMEEHCGDAASFVSIHLGIGLSLALGRWIRDLPKRKVDPGAGEG